MEKGKYVEITAANTDTDILDAKDMQIFVIKEIKIENKSGASATVELKDVYTDVTGASKTDTKLKVDIAADAERRYEEVKGKRILGTLKGRSTSASSAAPVRVYVGVEEV